MEGAYLVVARFRKPHGLKGEAVIMPLTDEPAEVFVPGRVLVPVTDEGEPIGEELVIARSRPFKRQWLLAFEGIEERSDLERWSQIFLGARRSELRPPDDDEMYVHEIPGARVVEDGKEIGVAKSLVDMGTAQWLVVERRGREHLIPFRAPIVSRVDRGERLIEVRLPSGLLDI